MRSDLLALSDHDLADISNRGNVKRATRELAAGTLMVQFSENADCDLIAKWSDGVTCVLKSDDVLTNAHCTCPAAGLCRHVVRTVLAYQREHGEEVRAIAEPWNPGSIPDDELKKRFSKLQFSHATRERSIGHVVELAVSTKPVARFHRLGHTIRFMVPGDLRYTKCDCDLDAPCIHALLAVWSFRDMTAPRSELVHTFDDVRDDNAELSSATSQLSEIVRIGLANVPNVTMDRIAATAAKLRDLGQSWIADILTELRAQHRYYHEHDARFSATQVADGIGEFVIRRDALACSDSPVPKLFIRGQAGAWESRVGQSRLVGLGCGAIRRVGGIELRAFAQDLSNGKIRAITSYFPDPTDDTAPKSYAELGRKYVLHGTEMATLGRSQLIIKAGIITSDNELRLNRGSASTYGQKYTWEELLPPTALDGFRELRDRLRYLPPKSLRPRRAGEDLHVVPIERCEHVQFDERDQTIRAVLIDAKGETATLVHPYSHRGASGAERLLSWLTQHPEALTFVAGTAKQTASGLIITPISVVFQRGDERTMIQPHVDDMDSWLEKNQRPLRARDSGRPIHAIRTQFSTIVGDAILVGEGDRNRIAQRLDSVMKIAADLSMTTVESAAVELKENSDWSGAVFAAAAVNRLAQELF